MPFMFHRKNPFYAIKARSIFRMICFLTAVLWVSCGPHINPPQTLADAIVYNRRAINGLSLGERKFEVMQRLGRWAHQELEGFTVSNPYDTEKITKNGRELEVLYYYTSIKHFDGQISDDELTPLVFENDTLIGWGEEFLRQITAKSEASPGMLISEEAGG